ncbi:AAA family ATPase [Agilicoccus flavus]|uniref:AAA family ATPase n=1 Tax=Agilicoccus flavus TaxID=2775968 RepID=UPI001CF6412F|nr:AAA family ATPase [Agilicoccus flavus]
MTATPGSDEPTPGRLVLVTGAQAAGKTTVGRALARSLPRAVHVDGDAIAALVVSGAVEVELPLTRDALEQLFLRWNAAIAVAETYQRAGFDAVISDNVFGELFEDFVDFVSPAPLHVVMLCPDLDTLRARDEGRPTRGYAGTITVEALAEGVADTPRAGLWLDTSGMSVEVTVAEVRARLDEALLDTTGPLTPPDGPGLEQE